MGVTKNLLILGALCIANVFARDLVARQGDDCVILLDDSSIWPSSPPVITDPADGAFVYPNGTYSADDRNIVVAAGDDINLSCVGDGFADTDLADQFATATCSGGDLFTVNGLLYPFNLLGCNDQPEYRDDDTSVPCGPNDAGRLINLGFDTTESSFGATIVVCFDQVVSRTFYAYHFLPREIVGRDTDNDRPSFDPAGYFDYDIDFYYTRDQQRETIAQLVGSQDLADFYVHESDDYYMSRGHLSPNADFVYYAFQDSSFYFINVAPQWQEFNGGNWVDIESGVRYYVEDFARDFTIYTGNHGVMQLDDVNNNKVDIYLYPTFISGESIDRLPVPKFYWKLVVDESDQTAVGLVGVNNIHLSREEADSAEYHICQDNEITSHPLLDVVGDVNDIVDGIVYGCTYEDLRAAFEEVPELAFTPGLLT